MGSIRIRDTDKISKSEQLVSKKSTQFGQICIGDKLNISVKLTRGRAVKEGQVISKYPSTLTIKYSDASRESFGFGDFITGSVRFEGVN